MNESIQFNVDFSVEKGNSVRTYVDCRWITTQVLQNHWLSVPENADLIVGYMFQVIFLTVCSSTVSTLQGIEKDTPKSTTTSCVNFIAEL